MLHDSRKALLWGYQKSGTAQSSGPAPRSYDRNHWLYGLAPNAGYEPLLEAGAQRTL
jgi:hypothetical protein